MAEEIASWVASVFIDESDHKGQTVRLNELLQCVLCSGQSDESICKAVTRLAESVVNQECVSMVVSRQFVSDIVKALDSLKPNLVKAISISLLSIVQTRLISFEEQVADLRFKLAELYEVEGNNKEAAKVLMAVPLETGQRTYPADLKMRTYLRISELALEYGDAVEAESFVNRASMLLSEVKDEMLNIRFKAQYARVLDHRQKFIEAAQRYYDLSLAPALTNYEKVHALMNAITCSILASSGAQRSRMLTTLYKDERCRHLPAFGVLQDMHLERVIQNEEIAEFEMSLSSHQRAKLGEWSILQRAIIEHNMLALSRICENITFKELAAFLDIGEEQAEKTAWQMIADQRIDGMIDQVTGTVRFTPFGLDESVKGKEALAEWDQHINDLCQHVNAITEMIAQKHEI